MTQLLADAKQREQAVDITQSYIVQAPAGSGKTEILTQRFLKLLSIVHQPEQIIALTFTRKAANEMRERVIVALQQVAAGILPQSTHQKTTHDAAARALRRDQACHWNLLEQPGRLRILTIDSLCQFIAHAIPLQENQIHDAKICENPKKLYLSAASACFQYAAHEPEFAPVIKTLLYHLDNRQDLLHHLLSDLLAKRDQWLALLYEVRLHDKAVFEEAIGWLEQHELDRFKNSLPLELANTLISLIHRLMVIRESTAQPRYDSKDSTRSHDHQGSPRAILNHADSLDRLDRSLANQLATLLLTSQNTLRKAFDHHVGLKRGLCSDAEYTDLKKSSQELLAELAQLPDFQDALTRVRQLPHPTYEAKQWDVLQALFKLLPLLVAHLQIIFNEQNSVDFTAISQQALLALGGNQNPTDLTLYLDNNIQHLLIDEFQDTSIQQFQLLSQLVLGFEPQDGRTLFVVGDPMQSIYRFRSAEVGLFLRARQQGIGPVKLTPLELTCNFRSTSTLVNWVNQQFRSIFPKTPDIESGAVSFHPSKPVREASADSYIHAVQFDGPDEEALNLVERVRHELQTYPEDDMAILVRSRRQLLHIVRTLREQHIPFQGVEIDLLANFPHLRDIWSLTQALLNPSDRLAWLCLLRSPWCGLSLADLHCIANFSKSQSIYYALSRLNQINHLSAEGIIRLSYVYTVLDGALMKRHQQPVVDWLTETLRRLHLDKVLDQSQQQDIDQFWILLEQYIQDERIPDLRLFQAELNKLYSKKATPARLHIMTIHKSKGLEFDCVFLPGLGAKPARHDKPLLRFMTIPTNEQEKLYLLSPIKAADEEQCLLYDYLGKIDAEKDHYELQRLLYVATTRAKKRLYLFDCQLTAHRGTFKYLLHQQAFIADSKSSDHELVQSEPLPSQDPRPLSKLYRLPIEFYQVPSKPSAPRNNKNLNLANTHLPKLIGIVAHELLQWICTEHPRCIDDIPWNLARHQLMQAGFTGQTLEQTMQQLQNQINDLYHHPIGQWLIQPHHEEQNESEFLVKENTTWVTRVIDRTFYHQNIRWVIDFKTGQDHETAEEKHRDQVNEYAEMLSENTSTPIRCGLYYLATSHWVAWDYSRVVDISDIDIPGRRVSEDEMSKDPSTVSL